MRRLTGAAGVSSSRLLISAAPALEQFLLKVCTPDADRILLCCQGHPEGRPPGQSWTALPRSTGKRAANPLPSHRMVLGPQMAINHPMHPLRLHHPANPSLLRLNKALGLLRCAAIFFLTSPPWHCRQRQGSQSGGLLGVS